MNHNRQKVVIDGIVFDSRTEAEFYEHLRYRESSGAIRGLKVHPRFPLIPKAFKRFGKTYRKMDYIADFSYIEQGSGQPVVVDVKGFATEDAQLKRKFFAWLYPRVRLDWVAKSNKYSESGWIDYDELQKRRRERKKQK